MSTKDARNELKNIRRILAQPSALTKADRLEIELSICRAPDWFIGDRKNMLDICEYALRASKKALRLRFI